MAEEYSTKELKELVLFMCQLGMAFDRADADGKIGFEDMGHFIAALGSAVPAFEGIQNIPNEVGDLSQEEIADMVNYVGTHLTLGHMPTQAVVTKAMGAGLALLDLYSALKS